ncbi:hypothetical protein BT96DRAFT_928451 [Gymnopus androsaceus JB14]|uniref:Uncharacterized protein n=1 Tax=Gymnopus androsaceus JB14 TaxID=1447944 RepID=A0A6A4GKQ4_9AGAR|nr:hypothetical protein BT96DRAFT_928442 [Gymnopus androsaceus JB14]KAE9386118.1 hypothetical protein BT96DRAFT_928451 [Gymnopus androsaceus JB14]
MGTPSAALMGCRPTDASPIHVTTTASVTQKLIPTNPFDCARFSCIRSKEPPGPQTNQLRLPKTSMARIPKAEYYRSHGIESYRWCPGESTWRRRR